MNEEMKEVSIIIKGETMTGKTTIAHKIMQLFEDANKVGDAQLQGKVILTEDGAKVLDIGGLEEHHIIYRIAVVTT